MAAVLELGVLLVETGRLDEAVSHYDAAVARFPDPPDCAFNHGVALLKHGDAEAAVARFQALHVAHSEFAGVKKGLGSALCTLGCLAEDEAALRETLDAVPDDAETHTGLGNMLRDGGRLDVARVAALKFFPDNVTARYNRSLMLLTAGDLGSTAFAEYKAARFAQYAADPARFAGKGRLAVPWDGGDLTGPPLCSTPSRARGASFCSARSRSNGCLRPCRGSTRSSRNCPATSRSTVTPHRSDCRRC